MRADSKQKAIDTSLHTPLLRYYSSHTGHGNSVAVLRVRPDPPPVYAVYAHRT